MKEYLGDGRKQVLYADGGVSWWLPAGADVPLMLRAAFPPDAVVAKASLPDQRIEIGRLGELERLIAERAIEGPALILIGDVVALADVGTLVEALPLRAVAG